MAPEAAVAACGSVAGALCGPRSSSCSVRERCRSVAGRSAAEAREQQREPIKIAKARNKTLGPNPFKKGSIAGALCGPRSNSCSV